MNRILMDLIAEPTGNLYRGLVDYAVGECRIVLLVVRKSIPLTPSGESVQAQLEPFLVQKQELSEWPGTRLVEGTAWVFQYALERECAAILKLAANGFYDWQSGLPEDPCFLRDDDSPWLVTIAHERDMYLCLADDERTRLFAALPTLEPLVRVGRTE